MNWEILIFSIDGSLLGFLPFEQIRLALRFNAPGRAEITLPYNTIPAEIDFYRYLLRASIRRNGYTLLSGIISEVRRSWQNDKDTIEIAILDDLAILAKRIIVPVPSGPPYTSATHHILSGPIETVMHQYVYWHAGAGAKPERRIPGLTQAADQGRGQHITARARFRPLLDMLQYLADLGGFGFRITDLQFEIYQPTEASIAFSREQGNLLRFDYTFRQPNSNYVYIGGAGQGEYRIIAEVQSPSCIQRWGRLEEWKDQRNLADIRELYMAAEHQLNKQTRISNLWRWSGIAALDTISLGQKVKVLFDNTEHEDIIRSITISTDGTHEAVEISSAQDMPEIYRRVEELEDSVSLMEVQ